MYKTMFLLMIGLTIYTNKPAAGIDVNDFTADPDRRFDVSEASRLLWKERVQGILLTPQISEGSKKILYSTGVASLDSWYPTPGVAQTEPPKQDRYHEFTYVNGLLTTVYSVENGKRELVYRIWHDQQNAPDLGVLYANGRELAYYLASYNDAGLISDVVWLNQDLEPMNISIFEIGGIYETCMITTFSQAKDFGINHRVFWDGAEIWLEIDNQKWRRANIGSKLSSLTSLQQFGIKPHYPIPSAQ